MSSRFRSLRAAWSAPWWPSALCGGVVAALWRDPWLGLVVSFAIAGAAWWQDARHRREMHRLVDRLARRAAGDLRATGDGAGGVDSPAARLERLLGEASRREELVSEALDAVGRQRDVLHLVLNASHDGLLLVDDGAVVLVNRRCAELVGVEASALVGQSIQAVDEVLARRTSQPASCRQHLNEHLERPGPHEDLLAIVSTGEDHDDRYVRRCSTSTGAGQRVFTFTDVTVERRLEQARYALLSTASHELRTPLTSLRGALQLVGDRGTAALGDEDRRLFAMAAANAERMALLIDDLLDLSRAETGRARLEAGLVDGAVVAADAVACVQGLAEAEGVSIEMVLAPKRPWVRGNRSDLCRVVTNLLHNAVKYSSSGGRVLLSVTAEHDGLEIGVEDGGPGVPREAADMLFRPFARVAHGARSRVAGTGLGLAICAAIVSQHGGTIRIEPVLPTGSRFVVRLPAAPGAAETQAA
ncbi:MAG: ATP-binding protein [Vicinamibacterales bacterium]